MIEEVERLGPSGCRGVLRVWHVTMTTWEASKLPGFQAAACQVPPRAESAASCCRCDGRWSLVQADSLVPAEAAEPVGTY